MTRVAVASPGEPVAPSDARTIAAAVLEDAAQVDAIGAAFLLASLTRTKATVVRNIRADAMTVDVLARLRCFPRSLRDWMWEEKGSDEDQPTSCRICYGVVLAPLFLNIESEGYAKKVGFVQPRADLFIPSLKLIIEAKFARASNSLKEIQRQLAQDAAMCFPQGSPYDRRIAFIWDDASRTEEHATLTQGLEKSDHVEGVVVVSRPVTMGQEVGATSLASRGDQEA